METYMFYGTLLIHFLGYLEITGGNHHVPLCRSWKLQPCLERLIRSYTNVTRGVEAAEGPLSAEDAHDVQYAVNEDLTATWVEIILFNQTCHVLNKLEMDTVADCVENVEEKEKCRTNYPEDDDIVEERPPSLRELSFSFSARIHKSICGPGCATGNYHVIQRFLNMSECWKPALDALKNISENGEVSEEHCRTLADYMTCQWTHSVGCEYLEKSSRRHFLELIKVVGGCDIQLPVEALKEPQPPRPRIEFREISGAKKAETPTVFALVFIGITLLILDRPHGISDLNYT